MAASVRNTAIKRIQGVRSQWQTCLSYTYESVWI